LTKSLTAGIGMQTGKIDDRRRASGLGDAAEAGATVMPPWSPSPEDMTAALELFGNRMDVYGVGTTQEEVKAAARQIKDHEPAKPSVVRAELLKLEQALRRARAADEALRENGLLTSGLREELKSIERKAKTKASAMRPRRSGGPRLVGQKNKRAAQLAFDMLLSHGIVPTLTDGGPYLQLTALLFKMATGQEEFRDSTHACTAYFHDRNWRDAREGREIRRGMQEETEQFLMNLSDDDLARLGLSRRGDWRRVQVQELSLEGQREIEPFLRRMSDNDLAQLGLSRRGTPVRRR
jgi:hypothetical protein